MYELLRAAMLPTSQLLDTAEAEGCPHACDAGIYGVNYDLWRSTGINWTTHRRFEYGHCHNSILSQNTFLRSGWICHSCCYSVERGHKTCSCNHNLCYK
ncbi:hypothetical protein F5B22DRAFT_38746 [Xylaria bambusicola]|uniref:uncharacterized protein n=1 Tax=Xylaria bambusicola TaxID=326684 RepID=UPI00200780A6|nr:uncharacterized protein F5B22DRAFT_38746 [Xylaria bambusicola]KAI0521100.1 hypothetical protein F5B22DRAFT_38746 [Xylaria bambusicola]